MILHQDKEGAPTPPLEQRIGGVERRGLVDIVRKEDDTPAAAIAIGGLAVNTNVEGQPVLWPDTAEGGGHCRVICRGECCSRLSNVFLARGHFGLDICVSVSGAVQFTGEVSARGGRGAELQSKGKHGGNSFRLEPGNCHQLSIPHVMTAYNKWAANQNTAKKTPFWFF